MSRVAKDIVQEPSPHGTVLYRQFINMVDEDGEPGQFEWCCVNPFALMAHLLRSAAPFGRLLIHRARLCPPTQTHPWRLIFYVDEVTPGNVMSPDKGRKCYAFYFSFREFGSRLLAHETSWMVGGVIRSSFVKCQREGITERINQSPRA